MDWYGITAIFLIQLPALGIGFIAGMLFMRGNYLRVIRWQKTIIARQQRQMNSMISPWN